ncbi:ECF transporter S component [Loigolactobacillus jiayinensis]|uniref:ECF transporter S component n=1 Tax=Loigolactobacillus jiayinensis TaxID=2486016 RepID=A0ABW1RCD6_9LACO|nr:ECF transporter S component [Loigolactobacillus jiayinensis]
MRQERNTLRAVIFTGLFAAIIFIGISLLRIPIPAMVGRPFIHFGNPLMVLAILFLGGRNGAFAGIIGLGGFDLLNGYAATSWLTALEVIVMAVVISTGFKLFRHDDRVSHIVILAIVAGVTKIITSYAVSIVEALMVGTTFKVALINSFLSLPATVINSISTAIIVPILYFALRGSLHAIQRRA